MYIENNEMVPLQTSCKVIQKLEFDTTISLTRDLVSICDETDKSEVTGRVYHNKSLTRDLLRITRGMGLKPNVNRLMMETRLDCRAPTLRV